MHHLGKKSAETVITDHVLHGADTPIRGIDIVDGGVVTVIADILKVAANGTIIEDENVEVEVTAANVKVREIIAGDVAIVETEIVLEVEVEIVKEPVVVEAVKDPPKVMNRSCRCM